MSTRVIKFGILLIFTSLNFKLSYAAQFGADKSNFKSFIGKVQLGEEIPKLFKSQTLDNFSETASFSQVVKANEEVLKNLEADFRNAKSFERGAIEDTAILNTFMQLLQLAILKNRQNATKKDWLALRDSMSAWFTFAADFPYEESSLVGLRLVGVVRSMLLDEVEAIQLKYGTEMAQNSDFRKWFLKVRAPWPVDRVIVSEARRVLKGPYQPLANSLAKSFQKNPYQSAESALKKIKGGDSEGGKILSQFWRDADIDAMKTEINRISKLQIKMALKEYESKQKKSATKIDELVKAGLLDQVPTDYFTGRPIDLTSL